MTISNTDVLLKYVGDGSNVTFALPGGSNSFSSGTEVKVDLIRNDGTIVPQTLTTDFTLDDMDVPTEVTMLTAPAADEFLVIYRESPRTQLVDFIGTGPFNSETNEGALDKITRVLQENSYDLRRALKTRVDDTHVDSLDMILPSKAARANSYLAFDSDSKPIAAAGADMPDITVSTYMEDLLDSADAQTARTDLGFTGAGGTVPEALIEDAAVATAKIQDEAVTYAKIQDMVAYSVIGRAGSTTGVPAAIAAPSNYTFLQRKTTNTLAFDFPKFNANTSVNTSSASIAQGIYLSYFSASSGNTDATLPSHSVATGEIYKVSRVGTTFGFSVIIKDSDAVEITRLHTAGETVTLVSVGSSWLIVDRYIPSTTTDHGSATALITGVTVNPTFGTLTRNKVYGRRFGDYYELDYHITMTTNGTAGTGDYVFSLPSGLNIDGTVYPASTAVQSVSNCIFMPGHGKIFHATGPTSNLVGPCMPYTTTSFRLNAVTAASAGNFMGSTIHPFSATQSLSFTVRAKISGWNT